MIIAVDFDGTIVDHKYPAIGKPFPNCFKWLKRWQALGAKLILYTMRCDGDKEGPVLTQAVDFCKDNGITFWGINDNPDQHHWTKSKKIYAHMYVDDAAVGCPVKVSPNGKAAVNWDKVGPYIERLLLAEQGK